MDFSRLDKLFMDGVHVKEVQKFLVVIWLAAGGPLILAALPVPALEPLRKLLFPVLRRGKLLRANESAGKGLQRITVPQSYFTHFYVLGLIWTTALFFTAVGLAIGDIGIYGTGAWRLVFLLLLFEIHLTRRLYECLFVNTFDPSARMSFLGYIIAMGYYTAVPLTLFFQGFQEEGFFTAFKGFLEHQLLGRELLLTDAPNVSDMIDFLGLIGWIGHVGAALFLYGSVHQHSCHEILASLRRHDKPGLAKKYGIPRGDWFELVSSAHYLAEIVIYAGLLLVSGGRSLSMWILLASVVANLYLLAKPTHEWYLARFDDYPRTRHALFPSFRQFRVKKTEDSQ